MPKGNDNADAAKGGPVPTTNFQYSQSLRARRASAIEGSKSTLPQMQEAGISDMMTASQDPLKDAWVEVVLSGVASVSLLADFALASPFASLLIQSFDLLIQ